MVFNTPNKNLIEAFNEPFYSLISDLFKDERVTFDNSIIIKHFDGTFLRFRDANIYSVNGYYIILTEHFGYYVIPKDTDLIVTAYKNNVAD